MPLKFPFSVILILTKLNGFVLCENRIKIMLQTVFKIIFFIISIFHEAFVSFALPISVFSCFSLPQGLKHLLLIS